MWYLSFSVWPGLLNITSSKFIHILTNDNISFFFFYLKLVNSDTHTHTTHASVHTHSIFNSILILPVSSPSLSPPLFLATHNFFMHPPAEGHSDASCILATGNTSAVNWEYRYLFGTLISIPLDKYPEQG